MKTNKITLLLTFIAALALSACGGSSGGGGGGGGGGGLGAGGFIKTVEFLGTTSSWTQLFNTTTEKRYQLLYRSADIHGSGKISSISLKMNTAVATAFSCGTVTVKMGHTNLATLSTTYANNVETGQGTYEVVFNNGTVNIPTGAIGDYFTINLQTPFEYNGVDNLVMEINRVNACTGSVSVNSNDDTVTPYNAVNWNGTDHAAVTGAVNVEAINIKFNFAGGENKTIAADRAGNNGLTMTPQNNGRAQFLILASDINGSGPVTGIQFSSFSALVAPLSGTYKVTLSHVDPATTALVDTFATNVGTGATVVADGMTVTVPAGVTDWWLPLTGYFSYNGTSNLLIDVEATGVAGATTLAYQNSGTCRLKWNIDPMAALGNQGACPRSIEPTLRFHGGKMNVLTDEASSSYIIPLGTGQFVVQELYESTQLGTGGTITSVGFRLGADSNPFNHTDVHLVLGHTTLGQLGGASLMANIESDRTNAFTGTISIPAGLKAGDWVEVPVSFNYNPAKNLVVQWDKPAYATGNTTYGNSTSARYTNHTMGNLADRTSDVGANPGDFIIDLSLGLSK